MDMKEELQYWIEEFQDLDPEEVEELLEAIMMDMEEEGKPTIKDTVMKNVFSNLNKRKHFDIDD